MASLIAWIVRRLIPYEAPPGGRVWWEPLSWILMLMTVGITCWMLRDASRHAAPMLGATFPWDFGPAVTTMLISVDTMRALFLFVCAVACIAISNALPSSVVGGLWFLCASIMLTNACTAVGTVIVLSGEHYLLRLGLLRLLCTVSVMVGGSELLIHAHYVMHAFRAPTQGNLEALAEITELRDLAANGAP